VASPFLEILKTQLDSDQSSQLEVGPDLRGGWRRVLQTVLTLLLFYNFKMQAKPFHS